MSTYENNRQRSEAANQALWSFMDAYAEAIGEHPTKNDPETRAARKIAAEAFGYLIPYPVTDEERATVAAMVEAIADRWTQDHEAEEAADRAETAAREEYEDEAAIEARASWDGAGYYRIAYSDGGQDYTNDGAVWYEDIADLRRDLRSAYETATRTHLPYAERIGLLEWHITVSIDETAQDFTDTSADGTEDAEEARELLRRAWNRRKPRRLHLAEDTARIIDVYSI